MYEANIQIPTATMLTPEIDYATVDALFSHMNIPTESHAAFDSINKKIVVLLLFVVY